MEEIHALAAVGIDAHNVTRFMQVTLCATPANIANVIGAAMDFCHDVVDVEWPFVSGVG